MRNYRIVKQIDKSSIVLKATNRETYTTIVVVHVCVFVVAVDVQVPRVITIIRRGRPKVAVVTNVVEISIVVTPTAKQGRTLK